MTWVTMGGGLLYVLALTAFVVASSTEKRNYSGYKLVRLKSANVAAVLERIEELSDEMGDKQLLDVWQEPSKQSPHADVLVAPEFLSRFLAELKPFAPVEHLVVEADVQKKIDEERQVLKLDSHRRRRRSLHSWQDFNASTYHSYQEMVEFMHLLSHQKSDMVTLLNVSRSFENRTIWGVKISNSALNPPDKPAILVDAGVHAREWIAPAVAIYMIKKIVTDYGKDPRVTRSLDKFDWYIIPQVNPDGYEFSQTTDRLWRKTRSVNATLSRWCTGADANRNWGYRWGEAGANRSPCSNIFAGSRPYSEVEIEGLKNFFTYEVADPVIYVSLHSYGQLFLSPWGYTNQHTENHLDQRNAAHEAVMAMRNTTGVSYNFGTISELMYPASGTSIDYMQHLGVPYIYGVELRPQDTAHSYAFSLPPHFIAPTGDEMLAALCAISDHAIRVKRL